MPISDGGAVTALVGLMGANGQSTTVHLFKNAVIPVPSSLPSDFVECDFDGYAPLASSAWDGPKARDEGVAEAVSPWFTLTKGPSPASAQSARGGWLMCSGPRCTVPQYLDGWNFDPPVPMRQKGNTLRFRLRVVAALTDGSEGDAILVGTIVEPHYESFRVRGLFRQRVKALAKRLQALIDDDARRAAAADFDPDTPFNSVFVDSESDVAAGIMLARCKDLLLR